MMFNDAIVKIMTIMDEMKRGDTLQLAELLRRSGPG